MTKWVIKDNYIQQASQRLSANIFVPADPGGKNASHIFSSDTTISLEEKSRGGFSIT